MSRSKQKQLLIYENLPSGGARNLFKSNMSYFRKQAKVQLYKDNLNPKNILSYLFDAVIRANSQHKKVATTYNYDLLIAYHSWITKSPQILRYSKTKSIYICHEVLREYYGSKSKQGKSFKNIISDVIRLPIKYIDKINLSNTKVTIIANSDYEAKLIEHTYGIKPITVYPGINLRKFNTTYCASGLKKKHQLLSVGAINRLKNMLFLVEVVGQIHPSVRPNLLLVGNGGNSRYRSQLFKRAKKSKVNLQIYTNVSEKQLLQYYRESKAFMYSPIEEPFGLVILEAMACGLPLVVSADGGGYSEILSKKNGVIIPDTKDANQWAQSVEKLLENTSRINKISQYNKKFVRKFSETIMNQKIWEIIENT